MSDTDDEREAIRERKRQELLEEAEGPAVPTEPIHVEGPEHLEELTADHDVVLVDFHADWCGPCQMLEPTVESIATDSPAAVAKVDIDANEALARRENVQGVPTLQLYAGGKRRETLVGVKDESTLRSLIDQYA
jgi:thioredoxin 1